MIKRVSELSCINATYKTINKNHFFSFDVMEYILSDENSNEYLLALAFLKDDKNKFKETYAFLTNKFGKKNILCFDVESLLVFFCPLPLCKWIKKEKNKQSNFPNITHFKDASDSSIDFSLNKFPILFPSSDNYVVEIDCDGQRKNIPLSICGSKAKIGTWNSYLCRSHFLFLIEYIFKTFMRVEEIEYDNVLFDPIVDKKRWRHNDFYLPLPNDIEELKSKISSKSRHNIKREKRIIEETFSNLRLENIKIDSKFPDEIIDVFYKNKSFTHNVTPNDYDITKCNVSDVYLLKTGTNDIRGVALSCEQGDIVFIENHTFDSSLKQYSFGQVLYDLYLESLICKKKKGLSLGGGDLAYKKRYGSICFIAFSGSVNKKLLPLISHLIKSRWNYRDLYSKLFFRFKK